MNIIEKMEKEIKEEIQRLTQYKGLDWGKVFFDSGEIDFHDQEIEVKFWCETYANSYAFLYDYERNVGSLYRTDKNEAGKYIDLWRVGNVEE